MSSNQFVDYVDLFSKAVKKDGKLGHISRVGSQESRVYPREIKCFEQFPIFQEDIFGNSTQRQLKHFEFKMGEMNVLAFPVGHSTPGAFGFIPCWV